jgi:hypothetical protein
LISETLAPTITWKSNFTDSLHQLTTTLYWWTWHWWLDIKPAVATLSLTAFVSTLFIFYPERIKPNILWIKDIKPNTLWIDWFKINILK